MKAILIVFYAIISFFAANVALAVDDNNVTITAFWFDHAGNPNKVFFKTSSSKRYYLPINGADGIPKNDPMSAFVLMASQTGTTINVISDPGDKVTNVWFGEIYRAREIKSSNW